MSIHLLFNFAHFKLLNRPVLIIWVEERSLYLQHLNKTHVNMNFLVFLFLFADLIPASDVQDRFPCPPLFP